MMYPFLDKGYSVELKFTDPVLIRLQIVDHGLQFGLHLFCIKFWTGNKINEPMLCKGLCAQELFLSRGFPGD